MHFCAQILLDDSAHSLAQLHLVALIVYYSLFFSLLEMSHRKFPVCANAKEIPPFPRNFIAFRTRFLHALSAKI